MEEPRTLTRDDIKQAVADLKAGRDELANPNVWIKRSWECGNFKQVCSLGALDKVTRQRRGKTFDEYSPARLDVGYMPATNFLACAMGEALEIAPTAPADARVITFNDHDATSHKTLLRAWDKAIALAEAALAKTEPKPKE